MRTNDATSRSRLQPDRARLETDFYFVNLEFFFGWQSQLQSTNQRKKGAPFTVPQAYFDYLSWIRIRCGIDYRTLEEISRRIFDAVKPRLVAFSFPREAADAIRNPHFTQIRRRLQTSRLEADTAGRLARNVPLTVVLDTAGPAVYSPDQWQRVVGRRVSRGWVRIELGQALESSAMPNNPRTQKTDSSG